MDKFELIGTERIAALSASPTPVEDLKGIRVSNVFRQFADLLDCPDINLVMPCGAGEIDPGFIGLFNGVLTYSARVFGVDLKQRVMFLDRYTKS